MMRLPSNKELWAFALVLHELHRNHKRLPKCDPEPTREYKGLLGQRRLAYLTGGAMDMRVLPGGDGHVDQWLDVVRRGRYPADVKVARWPKDLICAVDDMEAIERRRPNGPQTIFILGRLLNGDAEPLHWDAELLAWNWQSVLRKSVPKQHGGGIDNYWIPRDDNRDIYELLAMVDRNWGSVERFA
jgi:hypothetical protein